MKIYKYKNYEEYVKAQTKANKKKIHKIWVNPDTLEIIKDRNPNAKTVICHGTRNAAEQKIFLKLYENLESLIGTEISETAADFPMTIQHDFSKPRDEWISNFDIVYSNSFDHSICPEETLSTWVNQLSVNGKLYLDIPINISDNISRESDPLCITKQEILDILKTLNMDFINEYKTKSSKQSGYKNCILLEFKKG